MKYDRETIAVVIGLFLAAQAYGILVNHLYFSEKLPFGIEPLPDRGLESVAIIFSIILVMTLFILLLKRFGLKGFVRAWFFLSIWIVLAVSLSPFLSDLGALFSAFLLVLLRFKEKDVYVHNLVEVLVYAGIASIISPALGLWTAALLLAVICVYDIVSVFYTKHMVGLAKFQAETGIFSGLAIPSKKGTAMLGGGDIAFPMIMLIAILDSFGLMACVISLFGATAGLLSLILFGKEKKFYPAMPFISLGLFLGFLLFAAVF